MSSGMLVNWSQRLASKLRQDWKLQEALMTASYTRSTFDVGMIVFLLYPKFLKQGDSFSEFKEIEEEYDKEKKCLVGLLDQAVEEGLLKQPQAVQQATDSIDLTDLEYTFACDKIQETSRSLITSAWSVLVIYCRKGLKARNMARIGCSSQHVNT